MVEFQIISKHFTVCENMENQTLMLSVFERFRLFLVFCFLTKMQDKRWSFMVQEVLDHFMKHGRTEEEEQKALAQRLQVPCKHFYATET